MVIFIWIWSNFFLFLNLVPIFNLPMIWASFNLYSVISSCIFTERHLCIQYLLHVVPNISFKLRLCLWCCWDTNDENSTIIALLNHLWSNILPYSNCILTGCHKIKPLHYLLQILFGVHYISQFGVEEDAALHLTYSDDTLVERLQL